MFSKSSRELEFFKNWVKHSCSCPRKSDSEAHRVREAAFLALAKDNRGSKSQILDIDDFLAIFQAAKIFFQIKFSQNIHIYSIFISKEAQSRRREQYDADSSSSVSPSTSSVQ